MFLSVLWLLGILTKGGLFGFVFLGSFLAILVYRNSIF